MDQETPVWLLDVDGVLNATRPGWGAAPFRGTAISDGREWPIRWAPALMNRIRALIAAGAVEVRWCTTWCCDADQLERLFHLPTLGRAFTDPNTRDYAAAAKLTAARQVVADGRPLIWTDDAEVPVLEDEVRAELTRDDRALLIGPSGRCGLQPADMDLIEDFVARFATVGVTPSPQA